MVVVVTSGDLSSVPEKIRYCRSPLLYAKGLGKKRKEEGNCTSLLQPRYEDLTLEGREEEGGSPLTPFFPSRPCNTSLLPPSFPGEYHTCNNINKVAATDAPRRRLPLHLTSLLCHYSSERNPEEEGQSKAKKEKAPIGRE